MRDKNKTSYYTLDQKLDKIKTKGSFGAIDQLNSAVTENEAISPPKAMRNAIQFAVCPSKLKSTEEALAIAKRKHKRAHEERSEIFTIDDS